MFCCRSSPFETCMFRFCWDSDVKSDCETAAYSCGAPQKLDEVFFDTTCTLPPQVDIAT